MLTDIYLENVACYKSRTHLPITKEVTLIYGLNGTGKSTISNYLYDRKDPDYDSCSINLTREVELLVYNQRFIEDYFYEDDSLKGVFTLSKENKDIEKQIKDEEAKIVRLSASLDAKSEELTSYDEAFEASKSAAVNNIWKIKTLYTGGDRVLEFCIKGLMRKELLYEYLSSIELNNEEGPFEIEKLKARALSLADENATTVEKLKAVSFSEPSVETTALLAKSITASTEGAVAKFINQLDNSDWVSQGLSFVRHTEGAASPCPFCQEKTITDELLKSIRTVFDGQYKVDIDTLGACLDDYKERVEGLSFPEVEGCKHIEEDEAAEWSTNIELVRTKLDRNLQRLRTKVANPQSETSLSPVGEELERLNKIVETVNERISEYNRSIENKNESIREIKEQFWRQMRRDYDQVLLEVEAAKSNLSKKKPPLEKEIKGINESVSASNLKLVELRKKTVNVDAAVSAINSRLSDLGVSGFHVKKFGESKYRLDRDGQDQEIFKTLSEGEKTLISFLYFIERCHGTLDPSQGVLTKTIVIDDPISSLSHIYVFNIGQYIKREFVNNPSYSQVIVLTHSLYFFYELTFTKKNDRDDRQTLHRISKNPSGSKIFPMRYEEIQNDYQTYWSTIKDSDQNPALIANCMRNIIEHFFAFVRKRDFNNVFQLSVLSDDRFVCFNRYMNRESHSLGQNIFDIKEFNYEDFREGLRLVFVNCGYEEHYKAMMK